MSGEDAIRLNPVLLLNLGNKLRLKEFQKIVCTTARWKSQLAGGVFIGGLRRRQVSRAVSVRDADYNQIRDTTVLSKEFNGARRVAHVSIAVGHVKYGIAYLVDFISRWSTH